MNKWACNVNLTTEEDVWVGSCVEWIKHQENIACITCTVPNKMQKMFVNPSLVRVTAKLTDLCASGNRKSHSSDLSCLQLKLSPWLPKKWMQVYYYAWENHYLSLQLASNNHTMCHNDGWLLESSRPFLWDKFMFYDMLLLTRLPWLLSLCVINIVNKCNTFHEHLSDTYDSLNRTMQCFTFYWCKKLQLMLVTQYDND